MSCICGVDRLDGGFLNGLPLPVSSAGLDFYIVTPRFFVERQRIDRKEKYIENKRIEGNNSPENITIASVYAWVWFGLQARGRIKHNLSLLTDLRFDRSDLMYSQMY